MLGDRWRRPIGFSLTKIENKGLQKELDNIGNYKTEVNDALNTSRDSVLSNGSSAKEVENARGVKESMRKMTCREDFTGLDKESEQFMNDTNNIWSAETDDLNALDKHLDELSLDKKKQMQSNHKQEMVMLVSKGLGGVASGIGGLVAANHTTKAGKCDAASSLDQTSVGMLRESAQQASKTADQYAQEESQAIEMLVQLSQADVFRGS